MLLDGPYGGLSSQSRDYGRHSSVLLVVGGAGISLGTSILEELCARVRRKEEGVRTKSVELVWAVKNEGQFGRARSALTGGTFSLTCCPWSRQPLRAGSRTSSLPWPTRCRKASSRSVSSSPRLPHRTRRRTNSNQRWIRPPTGSLPVLDAVYRSNPLMQFRVVQFVVLEVVPPVDRRAPPPLAGLATCGSFRRGALVLVDRSRLVRPSVFDNRCPSRCRRAPEADRIWHERRQRGWRSRTPH